MALILRHQFTLYPWPRMPRLCSTVAANSANIFSMRQLSKPYSDPPSRRRDGTSDGARYNDTGRDRGYVGRDTRHIETRRTWRWISDSGIWRVCRPLERAAGILLLRGSSRQHWLPACLGGQFFHLLRRRHAPGLRVDRSYRE